MWYRREWLDQIHDFYLIYDENNGWTKVGTSRNAHDRLKGLRSNYNKSLKILKAWGALEFFASRWLEKTAKDLVEGWGYEEAPRPDDWYIISEPEARVVAEAMGELVGAIRKWEARNVGDACYASMVDSPWGQLYRKMGPNFARDDVAPEYHRFCLLHGDTREKRRAQRRELEAARTDG